MRVTHIFLGLALGLSATSVAADVIAERQANFKINGEAMRVMQAAIASNDTATIAEQSRIVANWSARMTEYFPEGSDKGNTKARADIWREFDKFTGYAGDAETAALELAALADGGAETRELAAGLGKLGDTCKTCHRSFKDR